VIPACALRRFGRTVSRVKTYAYLPALFAVSSLLGACSSGTKEADNAQATATAATESTSGPATTATSAATSTPSGSASAVSSSGPTQGPAEVEKDPDALVVDLQVSASSGTLTQAEMDKVKATFVNLAAASKTIAMLGTKGATGKRRVQAKLILDPVVEGKDKFSIKAKIDSVTLDGHCPFFNMKKGAEITRSIVNATEAQKADFEKKAKVEDTQAVRDAVVQLIFADLEAQQGKLKPNSQCLPDKK